MTGVKGKEQGEGSQEEAAVRGRREGQRRLQPEPQQSASLMKRGTSGEGAGTRGDLLTDQGKVTLFVGS